MKTPESRLTLFLLAAFFITSAAFFYIPFLPWNFHGPAGLVAAVLTILHVFMNRKTYKAYMDGIKNKKLPKKAKNMFYVDVLLLIAWAVAALSGIIRLMQRLFLRQVIEIEGPYPDSILVPIHGWSVIFTIVILVLHIIMHIPHIKAAIKQRKMKVVK